MGLGPGSVKQAADESWLDDAPKKGSASLFLCAAHDTKTLPRYIFERRAGDVSFREERSFIGGLRTLANNYRKEYAIRCYYPCKKSIQSNAAFAHQACGSIIYLVDDDATQLSDPRRHRMDVYRFTGQDCA